MPTVLGGGGGLMGEVALYTNCRLGAARRNRRGALGRRPD